MFALGIDNAKGNLPAGRMGLITNLGSVTSQIEPNIDFLISRGFNIRRVFTPEHGLYGTESNGAEIDDSSYRGIEATSLYGARMKPNKSDLDGLDFLVYDIQDAGVRFYTFISTLYNAVEASSENSIPLYVLDRPNPLNSTDINGPVLREEFRSFVGTDTLPSRYGLTIGELALFFNRRFNAEVKVVKMADYSRNYYFDDIFSWFIPPSLNLPDMNSVITYSGLCLLEASDLSVGRGTPYPFHFFGKPGLPELDHYQDGLVLRRTKYRPTLDPFSGELVDGYFIHITDRKKYDPFRLALTVLVKLHELDSVTINRQKLSRLYGSDELYRMLESGTSVDEILYSWKADQDDFRKNTEQFHLY